MSELFSRRSLLTVPNAITLVRLLCLPVFLWALFGRDSRLAAGVIIGCLGATDWVDGWVARRFNQTSQFGALFDPTVDRLLFIVGLLALGLDGAVHIAVAVLILAREIGVGSMMVIATAFGMERFAVTYLGKWATFILMFAVPALTLSTSGIALEPLFRLVGWVLVVPGLALSWLTAVQYVPKVQEHLRAGRKRRTTV
ncbi:MAG: CDP-diacylglycerol--glycerol-3-phosphate 3-phosphatidyltransferase [Actinomycetota bacterium]